MARIGRVGFLVIAVVFHLIYMWSIIDIYFKSPIVSGMRAYHVQRPQDKPAPAKRLVLFVGDGLRADKAFQSFPDPSPEGPENADLAPKPLAPFLRSRVLEHGTFGVSHTRVPTESRPGHVALIAGLYEDVSAVLTGWKLNPVNFDSVFNRSRHTWSWGSPDILPMFKEGAIPGRIDADTYGAEAEDYTQDATQLDIWVFNKVKALFGSAKVDSALDKRLREDKNVFFLHLLGLDTTGHAKRPYSKEYLQNIKIVDQGVEEITKLINNFYGDDQTAFVFTADHGMSDWGSHGDGHPDNTRTPLIVWGSGVAKPQKTKNGKAPGHEDGFSHDWNLDDIQRHDVNQADIAALMAYLAGLELPVNSVGELPLPYINAPMMEKASASLVNTQGILEMYKVKEAQKKAHSLGFKPYPSFAGENNTVEARIASIQRLIDTEQHGFAVQAAKDLLHDGLAGLRYLQTYDWLFLRTLITIGYFGWIAYALTTVIDIHVLHRSSSAERSMFSTTIFSSILVTLFSYLIAQGSPVQYYAYAAFPIFYWEEVFARRTAIIAGKNVLLQNKKSNSFLIELAMFLVISAALVQSYFHRVLFTICYIIGAFWPLSYGTSFVQQNRKLIATWTVGCLMLSTFTTLPVIKVESTTMISIAGFLMFGVGAAYLFFESSITSKSISSSRSASDPTSRSIMGVQLGVILLTIFVTRSSALSLQAKAGLPLGNQIVGWICLLSSVMLPYLHKYRPNTHYLHRLMVVFLTFSPAFIILTISYEGLFYFAYCMTLITWVRLEHRIHRFTTSSLASPPTESVTTPSANGNAITHTTSASLNKPPTSKTYHYRPLTLSDFRIALFTLFLLQSAFFSTGNIASISSFSLDAVYRLLPIFDPFSQGALLLFKILVPFLVLSSALGILTKRIGLAQGSIFSIVVGVSDLMTCWFFWVVRDEGSWLEIGTGISHFVIGGLIGVFVVGLEGVSGGLVGDVGVDEDMVVEDEKEERIID